VVVSPLEAAHHRRHDLVAQRRIIVGERLEATAAERDNRGVVHRFGEAVLLAGLQAEDVAGKVEFVDLAPPVVQQQRSAPCRRRPCRSSRRHRLQRTAPRPGQVPRSPTALAAVTSVRRASQPCPSSRWRRRSAV
jgi:hypothetical protein